MRSRGIRASVSVLADGTVARFAPGPPAGTLAGAGKGACCSAGFPLSTVELIPRARWWEQAENRFVRPRFISPVSSAIRERHDRILFPALGATANGVGGIPSNKPAQVSMRFSSSEASFSRMNAPISFAFHISGIPRSSSMLSTLCSPRWR